MNIHHAPLRRRPSPSPRSSLSVQRSAFSVQRSAFTLIEILIVIAVIVILAGIVVAIGAGVSSSAKERATKATLTTLDNAMKDFLKDHPEPTTNPANPAPDATTWVTALQALPDTAKILNSSNLVTNGKVLDAWGNPIEYIPAHSTTATKSLPFGVFRSYGRDGQPNTSDDLYSNGTAAQ